MGKPKMMTLGFWRGVYMKVKKIFLVGGVKEKAQQLRLEIPMEEDVLSLKRGTNCIHFLPVEFGDCILLESAGHFALIDAGGGGKEINARIVRYLKAVAGNARGQVRLDWALATHGHQDPIQGIIALLNNPDILFDQMYLKPSDPAFLHHHDRDTVPAARAEAAAACRKRGTKLVEDLPQEAFIWHDFVVQFFNTEPIRNRVVYENENSVGAKISCNQHTAFLSADINNVIGTERKIAPCIGQVDVLKLGHHGIWQSNTHYFVHTLRPRLAIMTRWGGAQDVHPSSLRWLTDVGCAIFGTDEMNGVLVDFSHDEIKYYYDIHDWEAERESEVLHE